MKGLTKAIANGNWSSASTWYNSQVPSGEVVVSANGFDVTIDQDISVKQLTNKAKSGAVLHELNDVPTMTGLTTPEGTVTYSSVYNTSAYDGWQAFDSNTNSSWVPANRDFIGVEWLEYEFASLKTITSYGIQGGQFSNAYATSWEFQAFNYSTLSWDVLHSVPSNTIDYRYESIVFNISNNTAYARYRLYVTGSSSGRWFHIGTFMMSEQEVINAGSTLANGSFTVSSNASVTCSEGVTGIEHEDATTCLYVDSDQDVTINSDIAGDDHSNSNNAKCVTKQGTGSLTINGDIRGITSSGNYGGGLLINSECTVNINGDIQTGPTASENVKVAADATVNIVGSLFSGHYNGNETLRTTSPCTINITGDLIIGSSSISNWSSYVMVLSSGVTVNLTGNIDGTLGPSSSKYGIYSSSSSITINHTGNIIGSSDSLSGGLPVLLTGSCVYNQTGSIKGSATYYGLVSTNLNSIHLLSGPFICGESGGFPFSLSKMHHKVSDDSYFEFRDNSTGGALPPSANAPATRLVSPAVTADAPLEADVRSGVTYSNSTYTGTLAVPLPSQVALGIAVDDTTGTAVLNASDVWSEQVSNITTAGSIGERLKNASTVESTGDQLESFL
jgi:hypothetical protein